MYVALMQGSGDNEHYIVNHVAIGAVVQELCQRLVRLQAYRVVSIVPSIRPSLDGVRFQVTDCSSTESTPLIT